MLNSIITSKARIRLLFKFFLNPEVRAYLRAIATEFNESTNAVRVELNRLVDAKLLKVKQEGRNKFYCANTKHPLFPEIQSICQKTAGLDHIISLLCELGRIKAAYITGDYARGIDSGIIDLVLIGNINAGFHAVISKAEKVIGRKIRVLTLRPYEEDKLATFKHVGILPVWTANGGNGFINGDFKS